MIFRSETLFISNESEFCLVLEAISEEKKVTIAENGEKPEDKNSPSTKFQSSE